MRARLGIALLLLLGLGAAQPSLVGANPEARGWDLRVSPDAALRTITLDYQFRNYRPRRLVLRDHPAWRAFRVDPRGTDPGWAGTPSRTSLEAVDPMRTRRLRLIVDVDRLLESSRKGPMVRRVGRDVVLWGGTLFPSPQRWPEGGFVTATVVCPGGVSFSVPWTPLAAGRGPPRFQLDPTAVRLDGMVAFGRFEVRQRTMHGSVFSIATLDRELAASDDEIDTWLRAAARCSALLFGRFPRPHVQIVLWPRRHSMAPVLFGFALQGGGPGTIIQISQSAPGSSFPGEFIGVHELLHLGLPFTAMGDQWFQEGMTTYYQEILRGRAGLQSATETWQNLLDGFARGRRQAGSNTLAEASKTMYATHGYQHVYWGGALLALEIDLAIRRARPGKSLDDSMRRWRATHTGQVDTARGMSLLAQADKALGISIAVPLAERHLSIAGWPPMDRLYAARGLRVDARGRVSLGDRPESTLAYRMAAPSAPAPPR